MGKAFKLKENCRKIEMKNIQIENKWKTRTNKKQIKHENNNEKNEKMKNKMIKKMLKHIKKW